MFIMKHLEMTGLPSDFKQYDLNYCLMKINDQRMSAKMRGNRK
jgi:hypothetical protein